jgi:hypothetical protein
MWLIMNTVVRIVFLALFALAMIAPRVGQAEGADEIKNCYSVHGESRYGALAWKHIVVITNRCDLTLQCEAWTDVDPSPKQSVTVEPKGTGEVLVRNNSPSRVFKAFGECKK